MNAPKHPTRVPTSACFHRRSAFSGQSLWISRPAVPNPHLPSKDSFPHDTLSKDSDPRSHSGCPTEPRAAHLSTGISFFSSFQCKMADSRGAYSPHPITAKRKKHRIQSPNYLSLGSNPGSLSYRLHSLIYIT